PRRKSIVLLTDGRTDAKRALAIAREYRQSVRVFCLGFGAAVDKPALARLAAERRGRFELLAGHEAVEARAARFVRQIATPVLVDLSLEAEGAAIDDVYPRALPDLNEEQELVISGRIRGAGKARLLLRGRAAKPITLATTVDVPSETHRDWVG